MGGYVYVCIHGHYDWCAHIYAKRRVYGLTTAFTFLSSLKGAALSEGGGAGLRVPVTARVRGVGAPREAPEGKSEHSWPQLRRDLAAPCGRPLLFDVLCFCDPTRYAPSVPPERFLSRPSR
ncbi:hypothetical protein R5R35_006722 [Gryllus longicercus]|uniref:Uncharacterized protein n=1 Tax=Gryllus longicercus TaxID=2509291 RepID=A0AAN9ZEF3_9ORTH